MCSTVIGEQKQVAPDAVAGATEPPAVAALATPVVLQEAAEDAELELDVKEEEEPKTDAVAMTPTTNGGKLRLDLFWRAFWCVL